MSFKTLDAKFTRWRSAKAAAETASKAAQERLYEFADALDTAPADTVLVDNPGHYWRKNFDDTWTCGCTPPIETSGLALLEEPGEIVAVHPPGTPAVWLEIEVTE